MPKSNLVSGKPGPGRPKGAQNKIGVTAKEMIASCAEGLGGAKRMIDWAKEDPANEKAFWSQIYPKLVPHEVTGAGGKDLVVQVLRFGADSNPAE
jgi:hypothetical protein